MAQVAPQGAKYVWEGHEILVRLNEFVGGRPFVAILVKDGDRIGHGRTPQGALLEATRCLKRRRKLGRA